MQKRQFPVATVDRRCAKRCSAGDPWVYDNEILGMDGMPEDGGLADVVSEKGRYLGTGFYNSSSRITLRIISRNTNDLFDEAFFGRRVRYAWEYRKAVMPKEDLSAARLIFGEADGFPGLTVDRFGDILSVQVLSLGTRQRLDMMIPALTDILSEDGIDIKGVYLRNDSKICELEGMAQEKGWYMRKGDVSPVTLITENGIIYKVDVENGQKTGFFLDQKYNRRAIAALAKGRTVLDCCTHTGSFALNCAAAGAKKVTAIDISASAIEMTRENAALNGLDIITRQSDVFDALKSRIALHDREADLIILDPPAFTKSKKTVGNARNGYLEINTLAMRLLPRGGFLGTASCSHFMTAPLFREMLTEAARAAGVSLKLVEERRQAPDHPILMGCEQTDYLKFYILQVV
ncbi:MAG: class I SAM-dependent rRNA methyltransferase [Oscillospiraceae bacterium]|nr:class I SAM-dependent rRNA methyltransferase [Oscillospiraceae bacterium]